MDNAGLPGKQQKLSVEPVDDIPEAKRETPPRRQSSQLKPGLIIGGGLGIGAIALAIAIFASSSPPQPEVASSPEITPTPTTEPSSTPTESKETVENILGHLEYQEAPQTDLVPIAGNSKILLRQAAAEKFNQMVAAARAEGIKLVPISGYRSVEEQKYLFFDVKAQRNQNASERADVSAPPGYSEHHTGYAVDIGDANAPATNLTQAFENTAAFQWLLQNAARYSFELSFPRDNLQGISYEPWHWRFVGDRHSLETFYKAQNLRKPITNQR
ncbi:M15 family metallopeptidase [Oscillatoria salina]|uniref:M15 family metallopeptidase n=1 Tax=Oscillatoria salina TaxID=331517 RepID=UPI0013B618A5|nr:M15 family metallopeptidase [Oscillatoria salina]MBZ8179563.1 D-alanyl-D-alanine carboxypeptidase family protein [Oscillatoria salina IIICB1]NET89003.1 D-alanyl-D-alanine carboxypeptidase family protein [Kamptonema sp. SIO1D9]